MTDIVERLRSRPNDAPLPAEYLIEDAVIEIERLRAALRDILGPDSNSPLLYDAIFQAEQRGAEREREECAKIAQWHDDLVDSIEGTLIAAAIRARTTTASETVTPSPHTQDPNDPSLT